jgi:hypothetical protein
MEQRTARLTILVDPRKKALFEELCAARTRRRRRWCGA